MKIRAAHAVIAMMTLIIALLSWALIYFARDELRVVTEEEPLASVSSAHIEDGRAVVRLSAPSQKAAGITVQALEPARREAEIEVYGVVTNPQPLAELRGRYQAAGAEANLARSSLAAAQSEYQRMDMLFRDERNVSEQALKAAEGRYRTEAARLAAAEQAMAGLRDTMRGTWGETLTRWATDPNSPRLRGLLNQSEFLVQLVFPYELPMAILRGKVTVAPAGTPDKRLAGRFVGASPRIDPAFPGETYFYLVSGGGLRSDMRLLGRAGTGNTPVDGVIVPVAAAVWHAGKAWAYVREDEETFARHEVAATDEMKGGWFNPAGFKAGDEVVVSGAQLLLSEELKYQIRNENED